MAQLVLLGGAKKLGFTYSSIFSRVRASLYMED